MNHKKSPHFHFSQKNNWMNDPNGLIKVEDVYHLFFQSNPIDKNWGNIGWGHATSNDLVTWEKMPEALHADEKVMIFSGSAITSNNTLGLDERLIAFYTACEYSCDEDSNFTVKKQTQNIAYSDNSGTNWKHYPDNPIIDINSAEFRDPKVIKLSDYLWLMLVTRARDFEIDFYLSNNLVEWSLKSSFSDCRFRKGAWECPDLIHVSINEKSKYILTISVDNGFKSGGSGVLYIIGDYNDGYFTKDTSIMGNDDYRVLDKGPDFFASQSFYNDDANEPPTIVGWLNNWKYAKDMPDKELPLLQSVPRQLSLISDTNNKILLKQIPTQHIDKYTYRLAYHNDILMTPMVPVTLKCVPGCFIYNAQFLQTKDASLSIVVSNKFAHIFTIKINDSFTNLTISRRKSEAFGQHVNEFSTEFSPLNDLLDIKIIVDYFCVEIFINDFTEVFTMHLGEYFEEVDICTSTNESKLLVKTISVACPLIS